MQHWTSFYYVLISVEDCQTLDLELWKIKENISSKDKATLNPRFLSLSKPSDKEQKTVFFKKKQKKMKIITFVDFVEQLNAL